MISPSSSFWPVRALNCLQNSIMLICACPSAGPTGGAGVALPAAICNFTEPVTFFAIELSLYVSQQDLVIPHLQTLYDACFSTCLNSNSTGVDRPKIVTITFNVSRSSFTSSTTPVNVANGPSVMRTVSFFSNLTLSFGLSFDWPAL